MNWIRRHQVLSFFLLVFAISWPAMFIIFYALPDNAALQAPFGLLATFSPVLIALALSALTDVRPRVPRSAARWWVFAAAWTLSWAVLVLHTWQVRGLAPEPNIIVFSALVALLPGWLISGALSRRPGVRELFATLLRPRGNWLWYVLALGLVPVIQMAGAAITLLMGGEVESELRGHSFAEGAVLITLVFLHGFFMAGGINEETGWRGFVLPRLQACMPVMAAVAILWFFWALWHIPYDVGRGLPTESIVQNRIFLNFIWTVLMVWLYNRTRGSLLAPVLFHPAMNAFGSYLPRTDAGTAILIVLALLVIWRERMWQTLPAAHPAVFHPAAV